MDWGSAFKVGVGDLGRVILYEIDPALTLAGSETVTFSMTNVETGAVPIDLQAASVANGSYEIDGVTTALTPADGVLVYVPKGSEFSTAGFYAGRFRLQISGKWITLPGYALDAIPIIIS
jgi:hypothetical protein